MKRVRYLTGVAGLAPMAIGAVAVGGAHATAAEAAGHAKTVSLRATIGQRTQIPDINRVNCSAHGAWLRVEQSDLGGEDCFANSGSEFVKIYHIDYVYTGNNGVAFTLSEHGTPYDCSTSTKSVRIYASACASLHGARARYNSATMIWLDIFP